MPTRRFTAYTSPMSEAENPFLSVIRVWAALAWAAGVIAENEAAALKHLIGSALLSEEEAKAAMGWLEGNVELDACNLRGLREDARHGLYRSAAQLAAVDNQIAEQERTLLLRLREMLAIEEKAAEEIEASVFARMP